MPAWPWFAAFERGNQTHGGIMDAIKKLQAASAGAVSRVWCCCNSHKRSRLTLKVFRVTGKLTVSQMMLSFVGITCCCINSVFRVAGLAIHLLVDIG